MSLHPICSQVLRLRSRVDLTEQSNQSALCLNPVAHLFGIAPNWEGKDSWEPSSQDRARNQFPRVLVSADLRVVVKGDGNKSGKYGSAYYYSG